MDINTAIAVKGLTKSYKQVPVLKGVGFNVEKGSVFALLDELNREPTAYFPCNNR